MNNENEEILENTVVVAEDITPIEMLRFAKMILAVISVLFFMGAISELIRQNSGIFEACKTILPPIATLVIGFYFGKSS